MPQLVHHLISWLACLSQSKSNCFTDVKPRNSAKRTCSKYLGCTMDGSRTLTLRKSCQTPKLPYHKFLVDNLWITRAARRPAPGAQTPCNSHSFSQFSADSFHASSSPGQEAAHLPVLQTPKLPCFLPFFRGSRSCSCTHRARLASLPSYHLGRCPSSVKLGKLSTSNWKRVLNLSIGNVILYIIH